MQDKLFFTGIPEERLEDTEAVLQVFFSQKRYKLGYNLREYKEWAFGQNGRSSP